MLCYLAKETPVYFIKDYPLGVYGKSGSIPLEFQSDKTYPEYDEAILNSLRNVLAYSRDFKYMSISIILVQEPHSLCQAVLQLQEERSTYVRDMSSLLGRDNFRVKVTLKLTDEEGNEAFLSSAEMLVTDHAENMCQDGSISFPDGIWITKFCTREVPVCCQATIQLIITAPSQSIQPQPNNHLSLYEKVFENELGKDVTIIAANGKAVKCHKCVLSASSPVFEVMFTTDMKERQSNEIVMDDMSEQGVEAFLEYIYFKSVDKPNANSAVCLEVLLAANKYHVSLPMQKDMTAILLGKPANWWEVPDALNLYSFAPHNDVEMCVQLKKKAAQVLGQLSAKQ